MSESSVHRNHFIDFAWSTFICSFNSISAHVIFMNTTLVVLETPLLSSWRPRPRGRLSLAVQWFSSSFSSSSSSFSVSEPQEALSHLPHHTHRECPGCSQGNESSKDLLWRAAAALMHCDVPYRSNPHLHSNRILEEEGPSPRERHVACDGGGQRLCRRSRRRGTPRFPWSSTTYHLLRSTFLLSASSAHNGSVIYRSIRNCKCNDVVERVIDNMELPPGDIKWNNW